MNECNKRFLERNGIVIEDVCSKVDTHIYSSKEVNPIIADYGFQTKDTKTRVSIANIVGYDTFDKSKDTNIFLSMDRFFEDTGGVYSTRSTGMLEYDKENIMDKLKQSFKDQPISLTETGEGTYTVLDNGLHRYTLLRILYLSEAAEVNGNKEKLAELEKKYTIPAYVRGIDLDKTYCKYLLTNVKSKDVDLNVVDVTTEYDSNYKTTGNAIIEYQTGEVQIVNNEQLLALTKEKILEDESFKEHYSTLQSLYNKYDSFAMFMDEEFSDIIPLQRDELSKGGINKTWLS